MAGRFHARLEFLVIFIGLLEVVFAVDDFTCVTKPRVPLDAEETFIAGFFVNLDGTLTVARTQYTKTGSTNTKDRRLPDESTLNTTAVNGDVSVSVLQMPASGKVSRIGVYACVATMTGGVSTSIGTVIMSTEADFRPTAISQTVNSGDAVRLEVTAAGTGTDTRWRLNNSAPYDSHNGNLSYYIDRASSIDAGTYEVHQASVRGEGKQALMRLLVRGCEENKWGKPDCVSYCPVCLNGGVCDDVSGDCICPPGFSGMTCQKFHLVRGENTFGQRGTLTCSSIGSGVTSCEGLLFCLPDPYGCSCATGYKGPDCTEVCAEKQYGADCAQMCHCANKASCDGKTGRCRGGSCASGYTGTNCQEECVEGRYGANCAEMCRCAVGVLCNRTTGRCRGGRCAPEYTGIYCQDECLLVSMRPACEVTCTASLDTKPTGLNVSFESDTTAINSTFTWNPVRCPDGKNIRHYNFKLLRGKSKQSYEMHTTNLTSTNHTILLSPCTDYGFKVAALSSKGDGPYRTKHFTTTASKGSVTLLEATALSHTVINVTWQDPNYNSTCTDDFYMVRYQLINRDQCDGDSPQDRESRPDVTQSPATITGMYPHSTYRVYVTPSNSGGLGIEMSTTVTTKGAAPSGQPTNVKSSSVSQSRMTFSWNKPECGQRNGRITKYNYRLTNSDEDIFKEDTVYNTTVAFTDLVPLTVYTLSVSAENRFGIGPSVSAKTQTKGVQTDKLKSSGNSGLIVGIIFTLAVVVIAVLLVAIYLKKRQQHHICQRSTFTRRSGSGAKHHQKVRSTNETSLSTTPQCAEGSFAETYKPSASTSQSTKPSSSTEEKSDEGSSTNQSAAIPSTSIKAPTKPKPFNKSQHKVHGTAKSASAAFTWPVAMAELAGYIKNRKTGKISGFQQDFDTLSTEPTRPQIVAKKDENKKKNRYNNILPYDYSRVTLETLDGDPNSDYINASYINGYKHESMYIACQGANQTSLNDMWRMIWQERVGKIVMLTNLVEKGKEKCVQYWPKEYSQDYGDFLVIKSDEKVSLNFILRSFDVSKISEPDGEYRKIVQFHYTRWPDMKPPESSSLLQFVRQVQISESSQYGPIIVHCSAGVGRTGTFIALDAMLEQARAEGQVDVLNFVREMRDKRYLMVQTQAQFKFIYEALLESSLSENTAISVDRFRQDYAKLKKRDKKTGTDGMEDQFQMLETFTASMGDDQCAGAKHSANVDKNRFQKCVPKDSTRPYLMTEGDTGSTNYINATFLDGSKGKHSYLATQAPLPCTIGDIWRLVFDYKSSCMIMLNSMDSSVPQYWPNEDTDYQVGPLTVKLKSVDQRTEDMIVRQFTVFKKNEELQIVYHIQFLQWPTGKDIPNSPSSLLKVLETVKVWTLEHPDGPLTVHCIDGEGCSGTFCTLVTLLDRLEQDGIIDVFQAVKKLRASRAGMVKTLAQYQLCYQLIKCHLDSASSSSIYENLHR